MEQNKQQTAVEWLFDKLIKQGYFQKLPIAEYNTAKAMEKAQMNKIAIDWCYEGPSYMYDRKSKYQSFDEYYNETYGTK